MSEKAHYLHLPSSAAAYVCACLALGAENTKDAALLRMPDTSGRGISRTVVIIVPDTQTGEMLTHDLRFFLSAQTKQAQRQLCPAVTNFFGWEILPFDLLSPADTVTALRLQALYALTNQQPFVLVATIDALMQRLVPPRTLRESVFHLELDKPLDRDDLIAVMERGGYSRSSLVEECGQYAVRGAVVDFFPPGSLNPLRVELFDDRVESLRFFDAATQRSSGVLRQFSVLPVKETFWLCSTASGTEGGANKQALFLTQAINSLRHRASELSIPQAAVRNLEDALQENMPWPGLEHLQPLFGVELASFWDYLPAGSVVAAWDAAQLRRAAGDFEQLIQERAKKALEEGRIFPEPASAYLSAASVCETLNAHAGICFDHLTVLTATGGDAAEESAAHGGAEADELEPGLSVNAVLNAQLRLARYKERPFKPLADQIKRDWSNGILPAIAVSHAQRMRRIEDLLGSYDIPSAEYHGDFFSWAAGADGRRKAQEVSLLLGALSSGFASGASGFRLIADRELFPEITPRRESVSARNVRRFLGTAAQLHEHDYVVHIEYGIGIYRGLKVLSVDGRAGDFLELEYAEGAKLFVPVENIGKVQK
ncbi:MAG TPA: CarD family transcriptional regulator, partial [Oligoflexia bacterium]|nr:CarD family transcriptional regulator [Oligoflexia bacterium]